MKTFQHLRLINFLIKSTTHVSHKVPCDTYKYTLRKIQIYWMLQQVVHIVTSELERANKVDIHSRKFRFYEF
jgi:hypothetical protein